MWKFIPAWLACNKISRFLFSLLCHFVSLSPSRTARSVTTFKGQRGCRCLRKGRKYVSSQRNKFNWRTSGYMDKVANIGETRNFFVMTKDQKKIFDVFSLVPHFLHTCWRHDTFWLPIFPTLLNVLPLWSMHSSITDASGYHEKNRNSNLPLVLKSIKLTNQTFKFRMSVIHRAMKTRDQLPL